MSTDQRRRPDTAGPIWEWSSLVPRSEQEAQDRRDALDEAILDDARWIRRKQEIEQQRQH